MVSWECPRCKGKFYSSHRADKDKYVICVYCAYNVLNPYYNPSAEDIREKQLQTLQKRVVELEAENRELKARLEELTGEKKCCI